MKKYIINFIILMALLIFGFPVFAATQDQVNRQENEIQSTINEISELDKKINNLEISINDLNQKIEKTSQDLIKAQEEEKQLTKLSNERIRVAYMYGTGGYFDYLFSGEEPSDFISHYDVTKDILTADKNSLKQLEDKRKEIETLQNTQISQRDQSVNSKNQAEVLKNQKQNTLSSNQAVLDQLKRQLTQTATVQTDQQVPITTVTPEITNNVQTTSSVPIVLNTDQTQTTEAQPNTNETQNTDSSEPGIQSNTTNSNSEELKQSDEASAASTSPRWLSALNNTSSKNEITQSGEGLVSSIDTSNPYVLQIPNTVGSTTAIQKSEFPSNIFWPLDASKPESFIITSLIGSRDSPGGIGSTDHGGIDIGASEGTAIIAAASGTVEIANVYGGYGNAVLINHGNGLKTLYGHMSSIAVTNGTQVSAGQVIGFVGSTGWSTGPHLHYEIRYTDNTGTEYKLNGLSLYGQDILSRLTYYC